MVCWISNDAPAFQLKQKHPWLKLCATGVFPISSFHIIYNNMAIVKTNPMLGVLKMNIESLIKAIIILHQGNAAKHALVKYSIARQIEKKDVHSMILDGQTIDVIDMIVTAKYNPFSINENTATRTIDALTIIATKDMETKLILQTNHTECPVQNGEIIFSEEVLITQVNQLTTIEEYAKICKEFELYFEDE